MDRMTRPGKNLMRDLPERVVVLQALFSAPSRLLVLRALLPGALDYQELFDVLGDTMSHPAVHSALNDLRDMGYVEDDAPVGVTRRRRDTKFTARRDLVTHDFGQMLEFVLG